MKEKFEEFINKYPRNRMSYELNVLLEDTEADWDSPEGWYEMLNEVYSQLLYDGKLTKKDITDWEKFYK